MQRDELVGYLDELLAAERFRDYCPNGIQVEGRAEVRRIVTGVTASQALVDAAVARGADLLLVHHGYFWRGEDGRITGIRRRRLGALLAADLNLVAYHLPLDAHPDFGNNAQLALACGFQPRGRFGEQDMAWWGELAAPTTVGALSAQLSAVLGRAPQLIGDAARRVQRVAWCTGAAQGYFEQAIALGVDVYLSGEISEPTVHLARESGVGYLAAGHHATERYGVRALGVHLADRFGLEVEFVDVDNPV